MFQNNPKKVPSSSAYLGNNNVGRSVRIKQSGVAPSVFFNENKIGGIIDLNIPNDAKVTFSGNTTGFNSSSASSKSAPLPKNVTPNCTKLDTTPIAAINVQQPAPVPTATQPKGIFYLSLNDEQLQAPIPAKSETLTLDSTCTNISGLECNGDFVLNQNDGFSTIKFG